MKVRHFVVTLFALTVFSGIAIAQRVTHPEPKTPEAKTPAPAAATHESAPAEHKPASPSHTTAPAARFQAVAASLKLSNRQQKGIASLIQSAHKELAAIRADRSLTPQQRQKAEQAVNLTLAQKFVGLLTPQQKKDLEAVLLKQTQKGKGSTANTNSAANSGSGGGSSPDIPSVDAPSGGDPGDSGTSSSSSTASSSSSSADAPASADASKSSSTSDSTSDSTSASDKATAAASSATVAAAPAGTVTSKVTPPSPAPAKKGRLSDAQLAAILDSFVQDEGSDSASKPSVPSGPGSGS
jgi:hypothetical protein